MTLALFNIDESFERAVRGIYARAKHGDAVMKQNYHAGLREFYDPTEWVMLEEAIQLNSDFGTNKPDFNNGEVAFNTGGCISIVPVFEKRFFVFMGKGKQIDPSKEVFGFVFGPIIGYTDDMDYGEMYSNAALEPSRLKDRNNIPYTAQAKMFSSVFSIMVKCIEEKKPDAVVFSGAEKELENVYIRAFRSPSVKNILSSIGYDVSIEKDEKGDLKFFIKPINKKD